ncbi:YtxH domain-containing protein [Paenibacillus alkaliterrae]|uniref:YtxH domain-containing protein n=1 Tax=Paenibacillus alkaliterrae TaxID=320909 RepID=UPI001F451B61|nr:YtxH domain-containing protein [Paenibacillus alkaliterrae]MCF2938752.1 YtxH domain-containing protein [Paenibacillus alkaliterrae]
MSTRKQTKGFLLGALAGGVVGSITALLIAPKAGKELRQDISVGAQKVSDTTVKVAGQVTDTTGRLAKQLGGQAVQIAGKTKQVASSVVTGMRSRNKGSEETEAVKEETANVAISVADGDQEASAIETVEAGETQAAVSKELQSTN